MRTVIIHVSDIYGGYYPVRKRDWVISYSDIILRANEALMDGLEVNFKNNPNHGFLRIHDGSEMIVDSEWRSESVELCEHGKFEQMWDKCLDCLHEAEMEGYRENQQ